MAQALEGENKEVKEQIINSVASSKDIDPTELPPLFNVVDTDALEAIFANTKSDVTRIGSVEFPYAGYTISIDFAEKSAITIE